MVKDSIKPILRLPVASPREADNYYRDARQYWILALVPGFKLVWKSRNNLSRGRGKMG